MFGTVLGAPGLCFAGLGQLARVLCAAQGLPSYTHSLSSGPKLSNSAIRCGLDAAAQLALVPKMICLSIGV